MSNQIFSNQTVPYVDQYYTLPAMSALIIPSNNTFPIPANCITFRKNGTNVTVEVLKETLMIRPASDNAILFGIGVIPIEYRPLGAVTKTVGNWINADTLIKRYSRWVFLPDGNLVIVALNSNYPENANLSASPPFENYSLQLTIGLAKNVITYCTN